MESVWNVLSKTTRLFTKYIDAELKPLKLTAQQYVTLVKLQDARFPINQLAAALGADRSTISRNLDVLQRRGLVRRVLEPDEALIRHALTQDGNALVAEATVIWQKTNDSMLAFIEDENLKGVVASLIIMQQWKVEA